VNSLTDAFCDRRAFKQLPVHMQLSTSVVCSSEFIPCSTRKQKRRVRIHAALFDIKEVRQNFAEVSQSRDC
jgi:hypothetical protein